MIIFRLPKDTLGRFRLCLTCLSANEDLFSQGFSSVFVVNCLSRLTLVVFPSVPTVPETKELKLVLAPPSGAVLLLVVRLRPVLQDVSASSESSKLNLFRAETVVATFVRQAPLFQT